MSEKRVPWVLGGTEMNWVEWFNYVAGPWIMTFAGITMLVAILVLLRRPR